VLCGPGHLVASSKIPVEDHIMRCWASKCLLVYVSCVLTAITNFGLSLLRGCHWVLRFIRCASRGMSSAIGCSWFYARRDDGDRSYVAGRVNWFRL